MVVCTGNVNTYFRSGFLKILTRVNAIARKFSGQVVVLVEGCMSGNHLNLSILLYLLSVM